LGCRFVNAGTCVWFLSTFIGVNDMSRELLQQCLDLITKLDKDGMVLEAELIFALRDELAKPEQIITPISPDQYERFFGTCGACTGKPWVGLTDKEIKGILDCSRGGLVDIKKAEQTLKDKNT
jgi:hypothetical protein